MLDAVDAAGVKLLAGGQTQGTSPLIREARRIVRSGELGPLRAMTVFAYTGWMLRPRMPQEVDESAGGAVVWRQAPHQIETVRYLTGGLVRSVRAITGAWRPGASARHRVLRGAARNGGRRSRYDDVQRLRVLRLARAHHLGGGHRRRGTREVPARALPRGRDGRGERQGGGTRFGAAGEGERRRRRRRASVDSGQPGRLPDLVPGGRHPDVREGADGVRQRRAARGRGLPAGRGGDGARLGSAGALQRGEARRAPVPRRTVGDGDRRSAMGHHRVLPHRGRRCACSIRSPCRRESRRRRGAAREEEQRDASPQDQRNPKGAGGGPALHERRRCASSRSRRTATTST